MVKPDQSDGKRVINDYHEEDFYMNAEQLAGFLRNLADEIEEGQELEVTTEDWTLPFAFDRNQIEVEIDYSLDELEIELEFDEQKGSKDLSV